MIAVFKTSGVKWAWLDHLLTPTWQNHTCKRMQWTPQSYQDSSKVKSWLHDLKRVKTPLTHIDFSAIFQTSVSLTIIRQRGYYQTLNIVYEIICKIVQIITLNHVEKKIEFIVYKGQISCIFHDNVVHCFKHWFNFGHCLTTSPDVTTVIVQGIIFQWPFYHMIMVFRRKKNIILVGTGLNSIT